MTEQKHFKYEGHVELKAKGLDDLVEDIEITGYQFLVPCKINMNVNGKELDQMVNVNLPDRKVFDTNGRQWGEELTDKFFDYMIQATTLPEDFYAADQETVDQAEGAKQEFDEIRNQQYEEVFNGRMKGDNVLQRQLTFDIVKDWIKVQGFDEYTTNGLIEMAAKYPTQVAKASSSTKSKRSTLKKLQISLANERYHPEGQVLKAKIEEPIEGYGRKIAFNNRHAATVDTGVVVDQLPDGHVLEFSLVENLAEKGMVLTTTSFHGSGPVKLSLVNCGREIVNEFKSNLMLDGATFKPFNEVSFKLDTEGVQDARAMLNDDELAKVIGKQLMKQIAANNKKQIDEGTVGQMQKAAEKPQEVAPVAKEEPNVAKLSMVTKIARQVEGEYVFVDVVKAHKDTEKLRRFLQENELPRTEVIGEVPCVVEYGVLEDVVVDTD
ncbi:unnamed protein product [Symbiodinium microadriaticum]|nr:unnamed protein product [Symbiodinium microadriaticum]